MKVKIEEYLFVDGIERKNIQIIINLNNSERYKFISFLPNHNELDKKIGLLFKKKNDLEL